MSKQTTKTKTIKSTKEPMFNVDEAMKWYTGSIRVYESKTYTPELHLKITTSGKHRSASLE